MEANLNVFIASLGSATNARLVMPGEREPEALFRRAEQVRVLADLRRDGRASQPAVPSGAGLLSRVRISLGRSS